VVVASRHILAHHLARGNRVARTIASMAERTSHPPGTISWAELATSDAAAAKSFYTSVFGWSYEDNPIGEGQVYSMATLDGKHAAALFASEQPPHWNCYVTVASADDTTARAGELGASVISEPFDVMDAGRMAVIADPVGAALCLWEPHANIGAQVVNTPGALTWADLVTTDPTGAERFYGELFGWTTEEIPDAGGYRVIKNGERANGGIMPRDITPNWTPYFGHEDVDRLAQEVSGLGGRVLMEPMPIMSGKIAVFADAHGAAFAVWAGEYT
jgi:predicted enzyme related to lactoylglutathione lyase